MQISRRLPYGCNGPATMARRNKVVRLHGGHRARLAGQVAGRLGAARRAIQRDVDIHVFWSSHQAAPADGQQQCKHRCHSGSGMSGVAQNEESTRAPLRGVRANT
jgi:hypothetical protein